MIKHVYRYDDRNLPGDGAAGLALERIKLIDEALIRDGYYVTNVAGEFRLIRDRIVKSPCNGEVNGGIGPESENYDWTEY